MFIIVFPTIMKMISFNLTKILEQIHYLDYMIQNPEYKGKIFLLQEIILNLMSILQQLKNI